MYGKKIIAAVAMISVVTLSAAMFAAYEAHIVNVTAKIENALAVNTTPIEFGTVFPEEVLYSSPINMKLSESFMAEGRVDDVEYVIRQKPKCALFDTNGDIIDYGRVTEDANKNFICVDAEYEKLPVLCPFLSKTPDNSPDNDESLAAFHGSITDWTMADTLATQVRGRLAKSDNDIEDNWIIDLHVPCFAGSCAQDYVVPADYELDPSLEHEQFGCDLWIEVTGISEDGDDPTGDVVINEVAWMGMPTCQTDKEWIELRNMTGAEIDLNGWTLNATDGNPAIVLTGVISANGYYLLEKDDDDNVPNVTADQIYGGILENGGEVLELRNTSAYLIDSVDGESSGWPAGNNDPKNTMERCGVGVWSDSLNPGGTPRAVNTSCNS